MSSCIFFSAFVGMAWDVVGDSVDEEQLSISYFSSGRSRSGPSP